MTLLTEPKPVKVVQEKEHSWYLTGDYIVIYNGKKKTARIYNPETGCFSLAYVCRFEQAIRAAQLGKLFEFKIGRKSSPKMKNIVKTLLLKKSHLCCWCKYALTKEDATIEHVIPLSLGGSCYAENLSLSCQKCNNKMGLLAQRMLNCGKTQKHWIEFLNTIGK